MRKGRGAGSTPQTMPPTSRPTAAERLARVRAIPRPGTPEDLARALERFRQRMTEPPLVVDWETVRDAEADPA